MKFEDSKYFNLKHFKLKKPFGNFYFLESFILSELNEGVHFDWNKVEEIAIEVVKFYGINVKVGHVSNRINSYSVDPSVWTKLDEKYSILTTSTIVSYNEMTLMNASIEEVFSKNNIKHCISLEEGTEWILNFNKV